MTLQHIRSLLRTFNVNLNLFHRIYPGISELKRPLSSSSHETASIDTEDQLSDNDVVSPNFINRNPRNLEQLGIARKRKGWRFHFPSKKYHHRLIFESQNKSTSAHVVHVSGETVISASTNEYAIAKHLYAINDVSAAQNVGRVIAQRCLESGITSMVFHVPWDADKSEKFTHFQEALISGGVELREPAETVPPYAPGIDYDNKEEMERLAARQEKVNKLGKIHRLALITRKNVYGKRNKRKTLPKPYDL